MENTNASPLRAMLRRDLGLCLRGMPGLVLIAAVLGLFAVMASSALSHGADSGYTLAPVAVVDEESSFTSTLAISMIAKQDFAAPLEVVKTKADIAEAGLADGTFSAALYLPKGYTDTILTGGQTEARLVLSDSVPLHSDVLRLLCSFGEELLGTGQFGIFAGERLVLRQAPDRHSAYLKKSNTRFMTQAMADPGITRQELSYAMTGVAPGSWYVLMYTMAFFQLLTLGFFPLTRDNRTAMLRRLAGSGISDRVFALSKLILITFVFAVVAALLVPRLGIAPSAPGIAGLASALLVFSWVGMAILLCLPQSLAVTAVTALTAAGLLASGGIIPRMELPRAVTAFGDLLPLGAAARAASPLFGGNTSPASLGMCLVWIAAAWAAIRLHLSRCRRGNNQ